MEGSWAGRLMEAKDTSASFTSKEPLSYCRSYARRKTEGIRSQRPWAGPWTGEARRCNRKKWTSDSKLLSLNPSS